MERKLKEQDATILDSILRITLEYGEATEDNLPPIRKGLMEQFMNSYYYTPYIDLLKTYDCVEINSMPSGRFKIIPKSNITEDFYKDGGFTKIYDDQQTEIKLEQHKKQLELSKLIKENKLIDWQLKSFWYFFILAILGGICGIISLAMQIFK